MSRFRVYAVDVSAYVDPALLERCGGKVWQVCVFDAEERTFCCESTPSYCLHPVSLEAETLPESDDTREALYEELIDANDFDTHYQHCWRVDADASRLADISVSTDEETNIDDAIEQQNGNPVLPACIGGAA